MKIITVEKTYLGELLYYMTEKQVKELFVGYGKVNKIEIGKGEVNIPVNVTVEHPSEEEAKKLLEALNKPPKSKWKFIWDSE